MSISSSENWLGRFEAATEPGVILSPMVLLSSITSVSFKFFILSIHFAIIELFIAVCPLDVLRDPVPFGEQGADFSPKIMHKKKHLQIQDCEKLATCFAKIKYIYHLRSSQHQLSAPSHIRTHLKHFSTQNSDEKRTSKTYI